ncbi:TetR/AcrR family transcriptional regulator [Clostridium sp. C8-1-8]|uniref:TetR/AcrR family transcriptional regulator n=1 Tax=Clostridium sp. C8-1-8 TaxID=2698831 RepID=UPI001368AB21|nr:TetR/AcrR family transcriptional regulator [Clostridium sp. C8-1-8]
MKNQNTNKTAVKYKEWIINAFFELLKEYTYEEITVKQIILQADVSRQTFYRHFNDKDDIVRYYNTLLSKELSSKLSVLKENSLYSILLCYFTFWDTHVDILNLLKNNDCEYYYNELMYKTMDMLKVHFSGYSEREFNLIKSFLIGGLYKINIDWLMMDDRETPEEIAHLLCKYIRQG